MAEAIRSLYEIIQPEQIVVSFENEERSEVIRTLVRVLVDSGRLDKAQAGSVTRAINEREAVGSTAIGDGVALPHARVGFTDDIIAAFGLLRSGTGFQALDGGPVRYVFLGLTPKENNARHIAFLKSITAFTGVPAHRNALNGCKTAEEVHEVLKDYA